MRNMKLGGVLVIVILAVVAASATPALAASQTAPADELRLELAQQGEQILWPWPAQLTAQPGAESSEVEVEIYGDGVLLHRERMEVERPATGKVGVLQLFARKPVERRTLVGMVRRGKVDLEARFWIDGVPVESVSVGDLIGRSQSDRGSLVLLAQRFVDEPGAPQEQLRVTAQDLDCSARNACLAACSDDYWDCIDSGVCFPQIICEECDNQLAQCQQSCPQCQCTDPKSVTTHYETFLIGGGYTGSWQCYEELFEYDFVDGWWYREWVWVYQRNEVQVTTYCDGSTSEQVVGTSYLYPSCYINTYLTCSYPFTWPPATC